MLILFPHLIHNPISPLVSSSCLTWRHSTHSQFTYNIGKRPLKVGQFVIIIIVIIVIRLNILRVILSDEVMKCCKCRQNEGLDIHVIHRRMVEHLKTLLDDPKDPLNDILSLQVTQIKQLFGVLWTERNISEI